MRRTPRRRAGRAPTPTRDRGSGGTRRVRAGDQRRDLQAKVRESLGLRLYLNRPPENLRRQLADARQPEFDLQPKPTRVAQPD